MAEKLTGSARTPANARRGSVYLLALGLGSLLTVIGLAVATTGRINARNAATNRNLTEAAALGTSAVDLAIATVNSDPDWRTTRGNDAWSPSVPLGSGAVMWKQVDETDSNVANNPDQAVRLKGIATVGETARQFSILGTPGGTQPLAVLSTTLHSEGAISVEKNRVLASSGGPISCDGTLVNVGSINGNVETATITNTGSIVGFVTQPSSNKSVPGAAVFAQYKALATEIHYNNLDGGDIKDTILASDTNPYGSKNASGVYYIRVPTGKTMKIDDSIVRATLLIELQGTAALEFKDKVFWEPSSNAMPSLLVLGDTTNLVSVAFDAGTVSVPALGLNLLGIVVVVGTRATAPSELHGLFHIMGGAQTVLDRDTKLIGSWITDGNILVKSNTQLVADPNLAANPPPGYTRLDATVQAVPGSFRWEER